MELDFFLGLFCHDSTLRPDPDKIIMNAVLAGVPTLHESCVPKSPDNSTVIIVVTGVVGILFSLLLLSQVAAVKLDIASVPGTKRSKESEESNLKLVELYNAISIGASSFLNAEYKLCALFVVVVFPALSVLIAWGDKTSEASWAWPTGLLSGLSFVVGAVTSMLCGFIGMRVAVFSNARCTVGACSPTVGWTDSFNTAFKAGGVMGFSLTGIALLSLYALICVLRCAHPRAAPRPTVPMHAPTPDLTQDGLRIRPL